MIYARECVEPNTPGNASEAAVLKDTREQLMLYVKENQRLINELRELRHSTINIMHGINGYLELEDWEGLKKYFCETLEKIKNTTHTSLSSTEKILNPSLKKLLYTKIKYSVESGIDTKVMIDEDILIENNLINETDLCKVIDEYLSNAIETASQAVNKKVSIYILNNEKYASIIIENTFKEKPIMHRKKTEALNKNDREPGVQPAGIILSRYPNVLNNAFIQHQVFVQELQIFK